MNKNTDRSRCYANRAQPARGDKVEGYFTKKTGTVLKVNLKTGLIKVKFDGRFVCVSKDR